MKKILKLRSQKIELGKKTLVAGILNVTPDSFSDGGFFYSQNSAISHAKKLVDDGADIIDIGAESTRPNFLPISADEEISRLEKIIPAVKNFGVPISIDTYKPEVAEFALNLGAEIINDVHGLDDKKMFDVAKKFSAPIIAMHNKKNSPNIIDDIKNFFLQTLETAEKFNFDGSQIIFDPGIGFGKTQEENLTVLKNLREFKNFPTLLGVSRKSVIGHYTGLEVDERDEATGAICVLAISQGVDIVRVHNVKMISKMCKMTDILTR
ncbi:MAG: dihydropteroate synthase [Selenomonadaceae bacterium]|nr:dihydropteroate synthase [Selenomonadaceae bacterium]